MLVLVNATSWTGKSVVAIPSNIQKSKSNELLEENHPGDAWNSQAHKALCHVWAKMIQVRGVQDLTGEGQRI
jgi:hypothetical protein